MVRSLFALGGLALAAGLVLGIAYPPQTPEQRAPEPTARVLTGTKTPFREDSEAPAHTIADPQRTAALRQLHTHEISAAAPVDAPGQGSPTSSQAAPGAMTAVWANDGSDKVTQDDLRMLTGNRPVPSRVWDGNGIHLFGAKNEVVSFNLVIEAAREAARDVAVEFNQLIAPNGFRIGSAPSTRDTVFDWVNRDIELFHVRYVQIKGLSSLSYDTYDERHIPEGLRRPMNADGFGRGGWADRPNSDKFYPDIAVPIELVPEFSIEAGQNQSVWADIYIPKEAPAGIYVGTVYVRENGNVRWRIPVELTVRHFELPDLPTAKTMVATLYEDITRRYSGESWPAAGSPADQLARRVMDRQFLVAHRHKISLIDDNHGTDEWLQVAPRPEWQRRLDGSLFTARYGYKGPGIGVGNNIYSIATFGWEGSWGPPSRSKAWSYADQWETWFRKNAPQTERFVYLIDESEDYAQTETWAAWLRSNPGVGRNLRSFATANLANAGAQLPSLDIVASWIAVGDTRAWNNAVAAWRKDPRKRIYFYNGQRPASGSFATEDDGVALRQLAWGQYKMGIDRWFFWEATYYTDFQGGRGDTNVFKTAQTFGGPPRIDPVKGMTGWNSSNGDGVLFYPGTDRIFPAESLNLEGPIASLRLKHWRRGIQDVDYIALARAIDPDATDRIVARMVPKALWEVGVSDPADPSWVRAPISWSTNPDHWEAAREELANIIERGNPP